MDPRTNTGARLLADPEAVLGDFTMPPRSIEKLRALILDIEEEARSLGYDAGFEYGYDTGFEVGMDVGQPWP